MYRAFLPVVIVSCLTIDDAGAQPVQTWMLFLLDGQYKELHTLDPVNARADLIGPLPNIYQPANLTSDGTQLFLMDRTPSLSGGVPPTTVPRSLWSINLANGTPTYIAQAPSTYFQDLDYHPLTGTLMGYSHLLTLLPTIWSISTTGNFTPYWNGGVSNPVPSTMAVSPQGTIWGLKTCFNSGCGSDLGTVDQVTFQFTPLVTTPFNSYSPLAFHPATGALYVANQSDRNLYVIDTASLTWAYIGPIALPGPPAGPGLNPMGIAWAQVSGPVASIQSSGAGCAGSNGIPVLSAIGNPVLGNLGFGLQLQYAAANATTWWFSASNITTFPSTMILGTCPVWLDLNSLLQGAGAGSNPFVSLSTDVAGALSLATPLFSNPFWAGGTIGIQVLVQDVLAPGGFTVSNALGLTLGF